MKTLSAYNVFSLIKNSRILYSIIAFFKLIQINFKNKFERHFEIVYHDFKEISMIKNSFDSTSKPPLFGAKKESKFNLKKS